MKKTLKIIISDGKNIINSELDDIIKNLKDGEYQVEIKNITGLRSDKQNRALHLWYEMMAKELRTKHIDKREFFKEPFFLDWTKTAVKEDIWRPIQKSLLNKKSTKKLNKANEINMIWDTINKIMIEKYKGEVVVPPFPTEDLGEYY